MRARIISAAVTLWIALAGTVLAAGNAAAADCSTLEARITAFNAESAKYNGEVNALNAKGGGPSWQVAQYDAWKARLQTTSAQLTAEKTECEGASKPKTKQEYATQATSLGYTQRISPQRAPFDSHGEDAFSNGTNYITPDNTSHNVTNGWKMFDRRGNRTGTYSWDLKTRIGA
ncbi:hypothetical protein ACFXHA_41420 [Nocardia sp. NPDC059240]|uniref:hypothetical protein n=1 Tax=Nocardia sp. NPDC059240 TaxID=3346786 RepID=UPI00369707DD